MPDISVLSQWGTNENPLDEPKDKAHFASANQIVSVHTRYLIQRVQCIDLGHVLRQRDVTCLQSS